MSILSIFGAASQSDLTSLTARVAKLESAPAVPGPQGPQGPFGMPGTKGDTGPVGPQGPAGKDGAPGKDGAAGKDGAPGKDAQAVATAPATPQPTDPNPWPLDMSAIADKTAPTWNFRTGPDTFELRLADNPGVDASLHSCFNLLVGEGTANQRELLKNITLTSHVGQAGGNHIVVNGFFGTNPTFSMTGAGDIGLLDVFVNQIVYNGAQWYDQSPAGVNSRSNDADLDGISLYNSGHSQHLVFGPYVQPINVSAPTATSTLINGADLKTILAKAATDTVLPAGTIVGTGKLNPGLALRGATQDTTIISGLGIEPDEDKAIIVLQKGSKVSDLSAVNSYIDTSLGFNGAGVRNETPDPIDVQRVTLRGNQNGILTDGSTDGVSSLVDISLDGNGAVNPDKSTPGNTHQMYLGGVPTAVYNGTRIKTLASCRDAHEIKCRAGTSSWTDCDIIAGGNGSAYDFSNGGNHTIKGGSISKVAGAADIVLIGFGMENANNAAIGDTLTIDSVVFKTGGLILCNGNYPNAKLVLTNCTYTTDKPDFSAFKNVTGDIVKAAS